MTIERPTEYGRYVRELRKNRNENLSIMAKKLDVSIPFLSELESGKRLVPNNFIDKLIEVYNLSIIEQKKLMNAIDLTNNKSVIKLNNLSIAKKRLVLFLARNINDLSDEKVESILNNLRKH